MKKVRNAKINQIVEVPVHCFAPYRSGWNGWSFRKGIIIGTGTHKQTGKKMYKVEYPCRGYNHTDRKEILVKWFSENAVFQTDLEHSKWQMQYSRNEIEDGSYDEDTEFFIDKGIIKETAE